MTAKFARIVLLSKANFLMDSREKWTSACDRILCLGQKQVNLGNKKMASLASDYDSDL